MSLSVYGFQRQVGAWCLHNFGPQSGLVLYGGTAEEVGELLRGAVKREQGIRGTREEWDAEIKKEIGDVVIKLASICEAEGWSLEDIITERWVDVSQRDWTTDKIGHGLPTETSRGSSPIADGAVLVEGADPLQCSSYSLPETLPMSKCLQEKHDLEGACHWCCSRCNYDQHQCPECGDPLRHNGTTKRLGWTHEGCTE